MDTPAVILSAFLDEGVPVEDRKDLSLQLLVGQALGLTCWTPRFVYDDTGANANICTMDRAARERVFRAGRKAGFRIACIGTAVGKVKLTDADDGNKAPYRSHEDHMRELDAAIETARLAGALFLRAFSFYPPLGSDVEDYYAQARDRLGDMVRRCEEAGIVYLMEPEPNLVGSDARRMLRLCEDIGSDHLLINPDAANMHVQGYDAFEEYRLVAEAGRLGYMHVKDYTEPCPRAITVDEEALRHFGSVDVGLAGHERIFRDLAGRLPAIDRKLKGLGADGLVLDVEGHMKGGGQFGGWSGPDGLGVAVRALTALLDDCAIPYRIRRYPDVEKK